MTLPASGAISFNAINVELGVSGTTQASLGQASYRTLAGVASGAISMSNFYGKANQFSFTISSNQTNANLRTLAVNAGWNQSSKVVATINGGVFCSSNSTGTPGLTINGSFPGGVELINNGTIAGMGGAGNTNAGSAGGLALSVSTAVTINNAGTIGGGGGGGGGGRSWIGTATYFPNNPRGNGGRGGGGRTGTTNSAGGNQGTSAGAGAGAAGTFGAAQYGSDAQQGGSGGSGGNYGASGSTGGTGYGSNVVSGPFGGGAAGGAITGNSNITYIATGTRLGSIS